MIRVNLVPQEILDKETQRLRSMQALAGLVVLFLILGGISYNHYSTKVALVKSLEQQKAELKRLEQIVAEVQALESQAAAVRARLNVMDDLLLAREFYPRFMSHLLETFPSGVWINSLGVAGGPAGLTLSMGASARRIQDMLEWYRTLKDSELFQEPSMTSVTFSAKDGAVMFPMSVKYVPRKGQS